MMVIVVILFGVLAPWQIALFDRLFALVFAAQLWDRHSDPVARLAHAEHLFVDVRDCLGVARSCSPACAWRVRFT